MTARTLICGYCGTHNIPGEPCDCPQAVQAREGRRAEMEQRLVAERHGVATTDGTDRAWGRR